MAEISYYFNTYNSGGEEWVDYPQRMVDNDLLFSAQSPDANVPDIQLLTGNTCDGTDLGTISKVELRIYGSIVTSASLITPGVYLRPIFGDGDGDNHDVGDVFDPVDGAAWSDYFDITSDTNAPSWTWTNVKDLDCDVETYSAGSAFPALVFKVEIRVTYTAPPGPNKRTYEGIPLGVRVRGQIGKDIIFRVRRGNGHQGAKLGKVYQDRYDYFVPSSINNPESTPYRTQWAAAVDYWKNILTDDQKRVYNTKAPKGFRMSGYNLFMRAAMDGEIAMYTDRGDPAAYDFDKDDLTIDAAWHDLDLSSIVPAIARAVFIIGHVEGGGVDWAIKFRKKGNTNEINHGGMETIRANVERHRSSIVAIGSDQIIQYNADNESWTTLNLAVRGWWT